MQKCLVCGKVNVGHICTECGFDTSRNYEAFPTFCIVSGQSISGRKQERNASLKQYHPCAYCGGRRFYLDQVSMKLLCTQCNSLQQLPQMEMNAVPVVQGKPGITPKTVTSPPISDVSTSSKASSALPKFKNMIPQKPGGATIAARDHAVAVRKDGTVVAASDGIALFDARCKVSGWTDIVAVAASDYHTVGLKKDGTVLATGKNKPGLNVSQWKDIVSVTTYGWHTVGLKSDGTIVDTGISFAKEYDKSQWTNIISIASLNGSILGLRMDGTVVKLGGDSEDPWDLSQWTNVVELRARNAHAAALKADGTVVALQCKDEYDYDDGRCDVSEWTDIKSIHLGSFATFGLKTDGTVVVAGDTSDDIDEVSNWEDIVALATGSTHVVGLKKDGTVVATGYNGVGQCNVSGWRDIVSIVADEGGYTIGIKANGSVEYTGTKELKDQISRWSNIKLPDKA